MRFVCVQIGRGAFATVYKALDTETGDFVAIKRIRVDKIKASQLMRLLSEGHLMEQLEHPHIVRFLGAIETEHHIHLVLEFVDSGSLASIVAKYGVLQERLCAVYLRQVLDGLAYLHGNAVVHRDIKSHNLLITSTGVVKVWQRETDRSRRRRACVLLHVCVCARAVGRLWHCAFV